MDIMGNVNLFKEVLMHPDAALDAQVAKKEGGLTEGVTNMLMAYLVFAIPMTLLSMVLGLGAGAMGIAGALMSGAIIVGMGLVGSLVVVAIYFVVAYLLGGRAPYGKLYYLVSLIMAPVMVLQLVGIVPLLGTLVSIVISIYALWLLTKLFEKLYKFGLIKAIAVWLVPLVIAVIVLVLILGVALVGMASALGALAPKAGGY